MKAKDVMWNDLISWGMVTIPVALACILGWQTELADYLVFQIAIVLALILLVLWLLWLQFKWYRLIQLAQLPWYIVIGYPDSGKRTLLQNTGLREAPPNIGPSRYLEPVLANRAIILEGTGVYLSHDIADDTRDEWLDLLIRLRKSLRGISLSGVIVTIGVDEIRNGEIDEPQAQRILERLNDLSDQLATKPPVYLVCTKSDQLDGFKSFFDDLSLQMTEQAWGATLTKVHQKDPSHAFATESQALYQALDSRRLTRVAAVSEAHRQATYHFPIVFHQTCQQLQRFVDTLFRIPADYEGLLFRGFYFTAVTPPDAAEVRLPYFTKGLFTEIIQRDQDVAQPTGQVDRQRWLNRIAMSAGAFLFAALLPLNYTLFGQSPPPTPTIIPTATFLPTMTATPTPSPTTTPTLTPTNIITPTVSVASFIVGANTANVREEPWGTILGTATKDQQLDITGQAQDWWRIIWQGMDGWVHSSVGDATGPISNVPLVPISITVPTTPTPLIHAPITNTVPITSVLAPTETPAPNYPFKLAGRKRHHESNYVNIYVYISDQQGRALSGFALDVRQNGIQYPNLTTSAGTIIGTTKPHLPGSPEDEAYNLKISFNEFSHPGLNPVGRWEIRLIDGAGNVQGPPAVFDIQPADQLMELYMQFVR